MNRMLAGIGSKTYATKVAIPPKIGKPISGPSRSQSHGRLWVFDAIPDALYAIHVFPFIFYD